MTESAAAIVEATARVRHLITNPPEEWYQRYVPLDMVASRAEVDRATLSSVLGLRGMNNLVALTRATGSNRNTHVCFVPSCAGQVPPQPGSHQINELGDPLPTDRVCVHGDSLRLTARRRITGRRARGKVDESGDGTRRTQPANPNVSGREGKKKKKKKSRTLRLEKNDRDRTERYNARMAAEVRTTASICCLCCAITESDSDCRRKVNESPTPRPRRAELP